MTTPSTHLVDEDLVLTVTCRDTHAERLDLPALRWFEAQLSSETCEEGDRLVTTDLARAQVVLVSLDAGLAEAFLQADAHSADLAAPMEEVLQLDRTGALDDLLLQPRMVLIIDRVAVPEAQQGHGHALRMLKELAAHFEFLTGPGLITACTAPDEWAEMDPFTLRTATKRLETILTIVGMQQIGTSSTWWASLETVAGQQ